MKRILDMSMLLVLMLLPANDGLVAGERDPEFSRRGGKAEFHMGERGKENTNAQWYADPDRGWVRAEERKEIKKDSRPAKKGHGWGRDK